MDPWLWIGLFVLLSYTVEAVTGFGSLVIALALGALLLPVAELLPVLVPLNVLMSGSLVLRHRRQLDGALLLRAILPLMLLGTLAGFARRDGRADARPRGRPGHRMLGFAGLGRGGLPGGGRPSPGRRRLTL